MCSAICRQRPLIITANAGRSAAGAAALARLAERFALPVVAFNARYLALPNDHPMHQGFQPRPLLDDADLVIVLDCDVPWIPAAEGPKPGARIVHIGEDPCFSRYPIRSFPADLSIAADVPAALATLEGALAAAMPESAAVAARRRELAERSAARRGRARAQTDADAGKAQITPEWISRCVGEAVGDETIIVNEYPLRPDRRNRRCSGPGR